MTTVKTCLAQKPQPVVTISVGPEEKVVVALQLMRDKRVSDVSVCETNRGT